MIASFLKSYRKTSRGLFGSGGASFASMRDSVCDWLSSAALSTSSVSVFGAQPNVRASAVTDAVRCARQRVVSAASMDGRGFERSRTEGPVRELPASEAPAASAAAFASAIRLLLCTIVVNLVELSLLIVPGPGRKRREAPVLGPNAQAAHLFVHQRKLLRDLVVIVPLPGRLGHRGDRST